MCYLQAYRILVGKADGKRPLARPRYNGDNIKMDIRLNLLNWIWLRTGTDRGVIVNAVMNILVP
jgi:hypothetical protein